MVNKNQNDRLEASSTKIIGEDSEERHKEQRVSNQQPNKDDMPFGNPTGLINTVQTTASLQAVAPNVSTSHCQQASGQPTQESQCAINAKVVKLASAAQRTTVNVPEESRMI